MNPSSSILPRPNPGGGGPGGGGGGGGGASCTLANQPQPTLGTGTMSASGGGSCPTCCPNLQPYAPGMYVVCIPEGALNPVLKSGPRGQGESEDGLHHIELTYGLSLNFMVDRNYILLGAQAEYSIAVFDPTIWDDFGSADSAQKVKWSQAGVKALNGALHNPLIVKAIAEWTGPNFTSFEVIRVVLYFQDPVYMNN